MPGFTLDGPTTNFSNIKMPYNYRVVKLGPIDGDIGNEMLKYAVEVQLPNFKVEAKEIKGSVIKYSFAHDITWEDVTIKFYDVIGLYERLNDWRNRIWNPQGGIRPGNEYKSEVVVEELDDLNKPIFSYRLRGAYPKGLNHGTLSYAAGSEAKFITVVIRYDFPEFFVGDSSGNNLDAISSGIPATLRRPLPSV